MGETMARGVGRPEEEMGGAGEKMGENQRVINEMSASIKAVEWRIDFSIVALGAR